MKKDVLLTQFRNELEGMTHLKSAIAVLFWDQEVYMPKKGIDFRARTISSLAAMLHEKFVSTNFEKLLLNIKQLADEEKLDDNQLCIFREVWREFEREKKMPLEFVKKLSLITSKAQSVWAEAREKSDFNIFLPYLKTIVELKRREANLVGFKHNPYDALIDTYEPNMTTEDISIIFDELKRFLIPLVRKIGKSEVRTNKELLKGGYSERKQMAFNGFVAQKIGFDFNSGRLDTSIHPFSTGFNPQDVRITTRYKKDDLMYSLMSMIHEAGHGMYEQGILKENFGTPLAESISVGIHESQSRIWENIVGRGKPFWQYFFPKIQKRFPKPFAAITFNDFFRAINRVEPSFIRTEADEVTYSLHVIMRFEIEKELIDGSIEVEDLPKIWNGKIGEYFGLHIPDDAMGVLQDVHWSGGSIGYFPTYVLGNLYSAQFYAAAKRDMPDLEKKFSQGEFSQFREWLRQNIHIHGKLYSAHQLVEKLTGEKLTSQYFIDYLKNKYSEIYKLR